jgi:hypothetical protein
MKAEPGDLAATENENRFPADHPAPAGLEQSGIIDFFAHDTKTNEVLLAMVETRPWDGSEGQLFEVQEKFNAYVSFLLDGELAESHPELAGKAARIELHCATMPEGRALDLLNAIHDQLALQEIRVEVLVRDPSESCGSGCTCGHTEPRIQDQTAL